MGGILIGHSALPTTSLEYCNISRATTGIYAGAAVTIQNCWIHDNKQYGINFTAAGLDQHVSNNAFGNNPMGDVYQ
jgi:nitrous oxidase accessory protein NosD